MHADGPEAQTYASKTRTKTKLHIQPREACQGVYNRFRYGSAEFQMGRWRRRTREFRRLPDKPAICRGGIMTWTWSPLLLGLASVWGLFTIGLIILLIYRSTLTMHEDEQLYLDDANSHMQQEQTELLVKVNRLTKPVWVFGAGSGVLLLVLLGMFIYQGLNAVQ
jgi:hypothetical protein